MVPTLISERWTLLLPEHRGSLDWSVWEREHLVAMAEVIGPGDLVYDVGAEQGEFGLLAASWGADVVLVEPTTHPWPNMRASFEANGLADHVRGWFVGFCGETQRGRPEWTDEHGHNPYASPMPHWPACAAGPVTALEGFAVLVERPDIPVTTVDRLAEMHGQPTVLTIDVEGAELTVLRGAPTVLSEARPVVFLSEHTDEAWMDLRYPDDGHDAIETFMAHFGYSGRHLATDHERHMEYRHPEGR